MKINKNYTLWIIVHIVLFLIISSLLNRSMFGSEIDKFYGQMQNVYNGTNLGILDIFYSIRYYAIYPFFQIKILQLPNLLEHLTLILYLSPILFFLKIPKPIRYFSILLLYMSLFFSYRTILVMTSIYMIVIHIKYIQLTKLNIFLSFLYSFLSSGTFLLWLIFIINYKKTFISSKKYNKYINVAIVLLLILLIGPISHKLLFFIDQDKFEGIIDISIIDIFSYININNLSIMFVNIFERSLIYEAYEKDNYIRLIITGFELIASIILVLLTRKKLTLFLLTLLIISLLFEGLMIYSLLFSILILSYDYLFRQFNRKDKGVRYAKNIIS